MGIDNKASGNDSGSESGSNGTTSVLPTNRLRPCHHAMPHPTTSQLQPATYMHSKSRRSTGDDEGRHTLLTLVCTAKGSSLTSARRHGSVLCITRGS